MLDLFSQLAYFFKIQDSVTIDNNVFRLHYKATVMLLVMCTLLVTARQYIGDPIDCMVEGIPGNIMDTYCWISSTFSVNNRWVGEQGRDHAHPGVAPIGKDGEDHVYHKYYQWVCFVLFFQAGFFYLPRYLWKNAEGGRINMLVSGMDGVSMAVGGEERSERIGTLVRYFRDYRGTHASYFSRFVACELLNLANVLGQMYFMDRFLGGEFSTYGLKVLAHSELDYRQREDPMAVVFPKVAKCSFHKYGPSGSLETYDALCVLPLNIINEKIYIFLWFWFILLASTTAIFMVYRFATLLGSGIRVAMIQARCGRLSRDKVSDLLSAPDLSYSQQVGDFFLLYLIGKNIDEVTMKEFIVSLHSALKPSYGDADTLRIGSKPGSTTV